MVTARRSFSEREFYLAEFRRRSIGIVWPADEAPDLDALSSIVAELRGNETRVVLLSPSEEMLEAACGQPPVDFSDSDSDSDYAPRLWRAMRAGNCAGLRVPDASFEAECRRAAIELRLSKVVWIQSTPPVFRNRGGARISVVDVAHLGPLLDPASADDGSGFELREGRRALLEAIRDMIVSGIPAVNVCAAQDISRELLTYAGAGTFFTRDRYAEVRKLSLDDFDPASDLLARGEEDGYLVPRDPASRDEVLAHAVGLFIEGRYLAGIGAILPHPGDRAAEIAALYALTRYVGEGVGSQIVRFAIDTARREGLEYMFSCTTSDRVEGFFLRNGLRSVGPDDVPKTKWQGYDPERRARVRCLRIDL